MGQENQEGLSQVLWIGGAPDGGKTTVATKLAAKYGLLHYEFDRRAVTTEQLDRTKAPRAFEWFEKSPDELWQQRTPEEIARHSWETYHEIFPVQLQDLWEVAKSTVVIAEGCLFLPNLVVPFISSPHQAVWLLPTKPFKQRSFQQRGKNTYSTRDKNSDPTLATNNFFQRDLFLQEWIKQDVEARHLTLLEVDGSLSPDEIVMIVETHFAPHLPALSGNE